VSEDLIDWLRAQIDDDEQIALAIDVKEWAEDSSWFKDMLDPLPSQRRERPAWLPMITVEDVRHIARHDPARVLQEVEAKKRRLDRHRRVAADDTDWVACSHCHVTWPCPDLIDDLLIFSGRPGFREEWRPQ
jgi:hypothetical protein